MKLSKTLSSNLKHFVEFLSNENDTNNWRVICSGFAEIKSLTEVGLKEYDGIDFGHLVKEEYFLITTRYLEIINNNMRIRFGNRIFVIKRIINPYQLNHILKILSQEITE